MHILLFNLWHIGDTFFAQPSVKCLCLSNPEKTFYIIHRYNYHLYQDIPNLRILNQQDAYTGAIHGWNEPHALMNKHETIKLLEDISGHGFDAPTYVKLSADIVAINTWIGSWFYQYGRDLECNPVKIYAAMEDIIAGVNRDYGLGLKYNFIPVLERLPSLMDGPTDIQQFLVWKSAHTRPCVFYYNFFPRSGQAVPVHDAKDHLAVIHALAHTLKDYYILVPKIEGDGHPENIINCMTMFNIKERPSCENVTQLAMIADKCEVSIHYNIGACFYYVNQNVCDDKSDSMKLHICGDLQSQYYVQTFVDVVTSIVGKEPRIHAVKGCTSRMDVIQKLCDRIDKRI